MSHHHHHHHHDEDQTQLSFPDKFEKILAHWLKHNDDHAATYRSWAAKARDNGMRTSADHLEEAARMTMEISSKFQDALDHMKEQNFQ